MWTNEIDHMSILFAVLAANAVLRERSSGLVHLGSLPIAEGRQHSLIRQDLSASLLGKRNHQQPNSKRNRRERDRFAQSSHAADCSPHRKIDSRGKEATKRSSE